MALVTLNQIVDKLRDFATLNPFVNDFGYGQVTDISTTKAVEYPLIWATHTIDSTIEIQNRTVMPTINFLVLSLDRINNEVPGLDENGGASTNQTDVMSDRLQVLQDLLIYIKQEMRDLSVSIDGNVSLTPIFDDLTDRTAGFAAQISFKLPYQGCITPIDDTILDL